MTNSIQDAMAYIRTDDYYHGLIVGLTVTVIEFIILSITIPFFILWVNKIRTRRIRSIIDFYVIQIFHDITSTFLDMASINNMDKFIGDNRSESHIIYGNLERKLMALTKCFLTSGSFKEAVQMKGTNEIQKYLVTWEKTLADVDRLIAMTGFMTIIDGVSNVQEEIFRIRLLIFTLRDSAEANLRALKTSEGIASFKKFGAIELEDHARMVTELINEAFRRRKKLIDLIVTQDRMLGIIVSIAKFPFVVVRRWISIRICRLRKVPYKDTEHASYPAYLLQEWREKHGFSLDEAAEILELSKDSYRDIEFGYSQPDFPHWESVVKKHLRGEVDYKARSKHKPEDHSP